jgi:hypothetical protein
MVKGVHQYLRTVEVREVKPGLEAEFGPGSVSPAGSKAVRLVTDDMLELGKVYEYNIFSSAGGWAASYYT